MRIISLGLFITISFLAQAQDCNDASHSVNIHDSWVSCDVAQNPNPDRGNSHWVMYDLGYVYSIGSTKFWNYNVTGSTNNGMKNISVDYSLDGINWTEGAAFSLSEAPGNASYEGETGPHLAGVDARYILISSMENWGGNCAGLSEVRFDIEESVNIGAINEPRQGINLFPNPAEQYIVIDTDRDIKELIIISSTGHEIVRMPYVNQLDISYLSDGIYFLKSVGPTNEIRTNRFVKQSL